MIEHIFAVVGAIVVARWLFKIIPLVFDGRSNGRIYGQRKYWSGN